MAAPPPPNRVRPQQPRLPPRLGAAVTIEDEVRNRFFTPDPSAYCPVNTHSHHLSEPKRGGKIHEGSAPSPLDHHHKMKAHIPGPGAYHTADLGTFALPEGGRVCRNAPVEKPVYHDDYPKPSPGHYGIPNDPSRPRQVQGQFSKDPRVSKFIMDEVQRVKHNPGPGAHDVLESAEAMKPFCPEGGRGRPGERPALFTTSMADQWKDNPAPGTYEKPSAINPQKAVGKLVYRYESATLGESRDLVNRMTADDGPGPGAYEIPNMHPAGGVPAIKGRVLPHAMPHPFAYNCAPDTAGKYSKFNSVLQKNSSDQIFGTGVTKKDKSLHAAIPKQPGRGSKGKDGDVLTEQDLKMSVPVLASEQQEEEVEWKAGGFSALKKSRSTGSVRRKEHPSVQEASKCYPKLQRGHRGGSQFLPMASRRSENVSTHESCAESNHLNRGKWHLGALAADLHKVHQSVLEPLDEEKLKMEAMRGLQAKAMERMRLEGVGKKQQQSILREMDGVLTEQVMLQQQQQQQQSQLQSESEQQDQEGQQE